MRCFPNWHRAVLFCVVAFLALVAPATCGIVSAGPSTAPSLNIQPIEKGQRVFVCGHSFHYFIAEPLAALAKEAGISDHVNLGYDFLGNSRPIRHWNVPDAKNKTKQAILTGNVDVLTLAPNLEAPDPGIDLFADLAIAHNPNVRVMLQLSWPAYDAHLPLTFRNIDRDRVTLADLKGPFRAGKDAYMGRLNQQVQAINERHHRRFVFIVPVGEAVLELREKVLAGEVLGISRQSDLFKDPTGHGNQPIRDLVTYCWYANIYHRSPVGLTVLDTKHDPSSKMLHRLLQEIAWNAVIHEPSSGIDVP